MPRQVFQRSVTGLSDGARNVSMGADSSETLEYWTGLYISRATKSGGKYFTRPLTQAVSSRAVNCPVTYCS